MGDNQRIEVELDERRHEELCEEAARLGIEPEELAKRAVCDWLKDMSDEEAQLRSR